MTGVQTCALPIYAKFLGSFSGNNGCMQVIADTIYYTGSSVFKTNCAGSGMQGISVPGVVSLAE